MQGTVIVKDVAQGSTTSAAGTTVTATPSPVGTDETDSSSGASPAALGSMAIVAASTLLHAIM